MKKRILVLVFMMMAMLAYADFNSDIENKVYVAGYKIKSFKKVIAPRYIKISIGNISNDVVSKFVYMDSSTNTAFSDTNCRIISRSSTYTAFSTSQGYEILIMQARGCDIVFEISNISNYPQWYCVEVE